MESGPIGTGYMFTWLFLVAVVVLFLFVDTAFFCAVLTILDLTL